MRIRGNLGIESGLVEHNVTHITVFKYEMIPVSLAVESNRLVDKLLKFNKANQSGFVEIRAFKKLRESRLEESRIEK